MNYRSLLIVCLATLGLAVTGWGQIDGKDVDNPAGPSLSAGTSSNEEAWGRRGHTPPDRSLGQLQVSVLVSGWPAYRLRFQPPRQGGYLRNGCGWEQPPPPDRPPRLGRVSLLVSGWPAHCLHIRARQQRCRFGYLRDRCGWEQPPQPDQRLGVALFSVLVSRWPAHRLRDRGPGTTESLIFT